MATMTGKFGKDVVIRFITEGLLRVRALIFLPIIAKFLGVDDYAIWTQVGITLSLLTPLLMLRLESACVRYLGSVEDREELGRRFFSMFALILGILLLVCATLYSLSEEVSLLLFGEREYDLIARLFSIYLFATVTRTFLQNYYRTVNRTKTYSWIQMVQSFSEIGLIAFFILYIGTGIEGAFYAVILVNVVVAGAVLADVIRELGLRFDLRGGALGNYIRFSLPLIPAGALYWLINLSDRYVILYFLGLDELGRYSAAYNLSGTLVFFLSPISFVLFPMASQLWEGREYSRVKSLLSRSTGFFLILSIPAAAGLTYLSPKLLSILATDAFVTSQMLMALLSLGYVFFGVREILGVILTLKEKTYLSPIILGGVAVFNVVANILVVPEYGITGAALTTLASYLVLMLAYLYLARIYFPITIEPVRIMKSVGATALMMAPLLIIDPSGLVMIVLATVLSAGIYFGTMFIIGGIGKRELDMLREVMRPQSTSR